MILKIYRDIPGHRTWEVKEVKRVGKPTEDICFYDTETEQLTKLETFENCFDLLEDLYIHIEDRGDGVAKLEYRECGVLPAIRQFMENNKKTMENLENLEKTIRNLDDLIAQYHIVTHISRHDNTLKDYLTYYATSLFVASKKHVEKKKVEKYLTSTDILCWDDKVGYYPENNKPRKVPDLYYNLYLDEFILVDFSLKTWFRIQPPHRWLDVVEFEIAEWIRTVLLTTAMEHGDANDFRFIPKVTLGRIKDFVNQFPHIPKIK